MMSCTGGSSLPSSSVRLRPGRPPDGDALTVGIQTTRAPIAADASTAAGFSPPTSWLRQSEPATRSPG